MEFEEEYIIPDTPTFNNFLLGEINSNLSEIKKLLERIVDQQEIKVQDLSIPFWSMFGLTLKFYLSSLLLGGLIMFLILVLLL